MQGKKDAEKLTPEGVSVAVSYIAERYPNIFESEEVMENVMYYGSLLGYYELDTQGYNDFGMDAVQAVKYVYRGVGVETIEDEATIENLRQMGEDAKKIVGE